MKKNNAITTEKSISEDFSSIWSALSYNQRRYAVAMLECATKAEAASLVGLEADTVYRWPDEVDRAVVLLQSQAAGTAVDMLASAVSKAVMVKIAGLDSDDEKISQASATEIIDRVIGRATQHSEITGKDGGPIETKDASIVRAKLLADIERRLASNDTAATETMAKQS